MIRFLPYLLGILIIAYFLNQRSTPKVESKIRNQNDLKNDKLNKYSFLKFMYKDDYFPNFLVDKAKDILVDLCFQIEKGDHKSLPDLYKLTHDATNKINDLEEEFEANESEIETIAREIIAIDFEFIANAYGYDADIEELIATREW